MHVDVDVGDAADAVLRAQGVDHASQIVEHAEPGGAAAARVVHAADRLKRAPRLARHDAVQALERASGDRGGSLQYSGKGRRVAVVQVPGADLRARLDPFHVLRLVEAQQLFARRLPRSGDLHAL